MLIPQPCPVCEGVSVPLDVVDFSKSCEEMNGKYLPLSGIPIYYFFCEQCEFCFAPEFSGWDLRDFEQKIYNGGYVHVDPEYVDVRPRKNASDLVKLLGDWGTQIHHLDYGGGNGLLSNLLCESGWKSTSYDPFFNQGVQVADLGKFDLITALEVFEHVPDVRQLVSNLSSLLAQDGLVLFTTLLSDGNIKLRQRISWWYAAPRNGHISLFSRKSLKILGKMAGLRLGTSSSGLHAFCRKVPPWAKHFMGVG
jgi:SAM-dependent methyltransferase